eukprot:COSAG02_NODE_1925_length_10344_cov_49.023231_10_plen_168_part_01
MSGSQPGAARHHAGDRGEHGKDGSTGACRGDTAGWLRGRARDRLSRQQPLDSMQKMLTIINITFAAAAASFALVSPTIADTASGGVQAATQRQVRWWTSFENEPTNENAMLALIETHPKAITGIYTYIGAGQGDSGAFSFGHSAATLRNMTWITEKVALFTKLGISVT